MARRSFHLRYAGSLVAAHQFFTVARGIWFPDRGLNPVPRDSERSLSHWTTREITYTFQWLGKTSIFVPRENDLKLTFRPPRTKCSFVHNTMRLVCVAWGCFFIPTAEVNTCQRPRGSQTRNSHWAGLEGRAGGAAEAELPRPPPGGGLGINQGVGGVGPPESGQWPEARLKPPAQPSPTSQEAGEAGSGPGPAWTGSGGRQGGHSMTSESQPGQHSMAPSPSSRKKQASRQPVAVGGLG